MAAEIPTLESIQAQLTELLAHAGPAPRFLSVKSAANYSDLSQDSIRRMVARGDLTGLHPIAGRVLVDREQLDRLILGAIDRPVNGRGVRK